MNDQISKEFSIRHNKRDVKMLLSPASQHKTGYIPNNHTVHLAGIKESASFTINATSKCCS